MKKYLLLTAVFVCCLASACEQQTGTPVEYANACDATNEKKYIEVVGYLDAPTGVYCSNTGGGPVRCGFKLLATEGSDTGFTADIVEDGSSNAVEKVDSNYQKKNINIRDNSGSVFHLPQKVKLVGQMNVQKNPADPQYDVCFLTVTKIEKAQ
jgi:hypothetical protein